MAQTKSSLFIVSIGTSLFVVFGSFITAAKSDNSPESTFSRGRFHLAVFSKDGKRLLTASSAENHLAQLWSIETGKLIQTFQGHGAPIHSICFSPNEQQIATGAGNAGVVGANDPTIRIWDVGTGKNISTLDSNGTYVVAVEFSRHGESILGVSRSLVGLPNSATVWEATTYEKRLSIADVVITSKSTTMIAPPRFEPSGETIAGLVDDGYRIRLWNAKTGEVIWQFDGEELAEKGQDRVGFGALEFTSNGKLVLSPCSDNIARTWDTTTGWITRSFEGHTGNIRSATFCSGGKRIVTVAMDGTARLWETDSGREVRRFDHPGPVTEVVIASGGARMITKWSEKVDAGREKGTPKWFASLWDMESGRQIRRFDLGKPPNAALIVFSPDGDKVFTNVSIEQSALIDSRTGAIVKTYN
jgi:WD40 repeat protein